MADATASTSTIRGIEIIFPSMMRLLLAFLAVVGLLFSPVTAAAAQRTCLEMGPVAMASMQMAPTDPGGAAESDPCCDHGNTKPDSHKACAQACASMCAVSAALPTSSFAVPALQAAQVYAVKVHTLHAHSPPRDERPPKLIA